MDTGAPLVSLVPSTTLVFNLEKGTQPRTVLKITNTSNYKIVFKVKTTQPTWYYVRPNQQMLDAGQTEEVAILLVDTECNRFLEQSSANTEEKLDKHRFLVQSKVIDDAEFSRISGLASQLRSDEFTRIWEGPKDDRKNIKLKVEFKYPEVRAASRPAATVTLESSEGVRNRLSRNENQSSRGEDSAAPSSASPEAMFAELQNLRKKYDAVVEYTVHLTAERDAIVSQLETSQRELVKEKSKKKAGAAVDSADKSEVTERTTTRDRKGEKGFSLFVILFVALLCFLLGKYLV